MTATVDADQKNGQDIFAVSSRDAEIAVKNSKSSLAPLTRRQLFIIFSLSYGNFCMGCIYSLLAPFFPKEAEEKGVSPTQYGLIFGLYEFGMFLAAPVVGKLIPHLSPKFLLSIGLFINGYSMCVFGFLEWSPHGSVFFVSALCLRLASSIGGASFMTACFTLIAIDFPDRLSFLYATTEMCFGFGMIVGPTIGGVLYEVGGFVLPFLVAGVTTVFGALMLHLLLPEPKLIKKSSESKVGVFNLLSNFGIFLNIMITLTTFMNVGFNDATLEHHMRTFTSMKPSMIGAIFLVSGLIYAMCSQVWAIVINKCDSALPFSLIGYVLSLAFFVLSGPVYPLPLEPSIALIIISQVLYGISMGGQLVGSFTEGLRRVTSGGYGDDIGTSAAMSSLYQSACSLGAALGPALGGYLMDTYGYRKASISMVLLQIIMIVAIILFMAYEKCNKKPAPLAIEGIEDKSVATTTIN